MKIRRVLIANRGEIAVRIIRACQMLGIETVIATSEADREAMPAQLADRAICIGPARSADSYLNYRAIVTAALATGCDAGHIRAYGFLSEKPELADACASAGLIFVEADGRSHAQDGRQDRRPCARARGGRANASRARKRSPRAPRRSRLRRAVGYPVHDEGGGGRRWAWHEGRS